MWRLATTLLLVLVAWASASPQGYVYTQPEVVPCETTTSTVYTTRLHTSVDYKTVEKVETTYITKTSVSELVIPTTVLQTSVYTDVQYKTSVVLSTTDYVINRVETETVSSPPEAETRYVTTTRTVPKVTYVTKTNVETEVVPVEVTSTEVESVYKPVTKYQTKVEEETYVLSTPAPEVVKTNVQTVVQTSIVESQEPATTRYETSTTVVEEEETSVVQLEDVETTRVVDILDVTPYTTVNTCYKSTIVTNEQVITSTNTITETDVTTNYISKTVRRTKYLPTTTYTTRYVTRGSPVTKVNTKVQKHTVTPYPVMKTNVITKTSVTKVGGYGYGRVVTKQVRQTKTQDKTVYETAGNANHNTVTRTVTKPCGATETKATYKYEAPAVPFHFG